MARDSAAMVDEGNVETGDLDDATLRARELYTQGIALVNAAQWGEALAKFEESSSLRSHPVTTYNVAVCERALGRYTRARITFANALAEASEATPLPASMAKDACSIPRSGTRRRSSRCRRCGPSCAAA